MLATFVIGLREGLEAALIVGIIAAFLRTNGQSLTAMWVGVGLALLLSIAVGVGLDAVERALPQAGQEGMETIIGAIAVVFVTGMTVWMNAHARSLKHDLEAQAALAVGRTGALALALMAFLAVLREGFETSVFLLATFSAAQSASLAAAGALLGILLAVAIGWGIYAGGVHLNLGRFFRITGAFLILVAAGLTLNALRTAHEAGWLNAGQQATVDLGWLVRPGTLQSALITGVLGIPADPRLIEVLGWFAYLIPVALFIYWPASHRLSPAGAIRLRIAIGSALLIVAAGLALGIPTPRPAIPAQAPILADGGGQVIGTARLTNGAGGGSHVLDLSFTEADASSLALSADKARKGDHHSVPGRAWTFDDSAVPVAVPATLTLDQVMALSGGRIPVGLNPRSHPGPYDASWRTRSGTTVWTVQGKLLDAVAQRTTLVTLSGGGLETPRVLFVHSDDPSLSGGWRIAPAYVARAAAAARTAAAGRTERFFWAVQLPVLLTLAAGLLFIIALRNTRRLRRAGRISPPLRPARPVLSPQNPHGEDSMPQTRLVRQVVVLTGLGAAAMFGPAAAWAQQSQVAPVRNGAAQVGITLTGDDGGTCVLDHDTAAAGPVTFSVTNKTATAITEVELQSDNRILGEKENLAPGLPTVAMTLTLGGGTYQLYCPGAKNQMLTFTVTGAAAPESQGSVASLLRQGTKGYGHYVDGVASAMVTAVTNLKAAIDAGDLAKAKAEYPLARPYYERIESDVDGFVMPGFKATDNAGNLDYLIDMRATNLDPKVGWHGFHAIERDLYQNGRITDETKQLAAELLKNVETLNALVTKLSYKPEDLANGAADLLEEVQRTKISGEEEAFSHIDLVDFAGNVEGAEQAFAFLEPGLDKIDPDLTAQIRRQFTQVRALLDTYRDPSIPGDRKLYTAELKATDAAKLSRSIQALQEPMAKIAERVATASATQ